MWPLLFVDSIFLYPQNPLIATNDFVLFVLEIFKSLYLLTKYVSANEATVVGNDGIPNILFAVLRNIVSPSPI